MSVSKRDQTMNEFKYNIGYALSGGFIKGFAHLLSLIHISEPTRPY